MVKYVCRTWSFYRSVFIRGFSRCNIANSHESPEQNVKGKSAKEMLEESSMIDEVEVTESKEEVWATSPYPKIQGSDKRNQALFSFRPRVDPRDTSIILFPGQGTQFVGMGKNLMKIPAVKDLFEEANHILRYNLMDICLNGPKEKLNRTEFAQPAILVCSLAALERLKEEKPKAIENCCATAGFSLGELTALIFAEAIKFEQALRLVRVRAESMQLAAEMEEGAMVMVMFSPDSKLSFACKSAKEYAISEGIPNAYCGVSNYLFPHSKIIAGHEKAIKYLEENKDKFNLKRMKRLQVSGAFHTPLMQPAIEPFVEALKKTKIYEPTIAVHSNVDGKHYQNANHIKKQLPKQILAPVKWEQTLHILYERPKDMPFPQTYECGPGQSLSTILKMVNVKAHENCFNVPA
ncbi:probable malonyl-CoA-acyl carrier protein transacylase, mitochondrial [Cimex lectularius]|uniref:[acyl-carrier-protein] S-malonyltransferase n=1 Tax=Cimex lectularius TaxID=79782 RepID=A0A8I6RE61_CIMLE|nr:probable malonyl-CoA-acyl carrier protein transacylase, mitochondrial [Cimex lectularius]